MTWRGHMRARGARPHVALLAMVALSVAMVALARRMDAAGAGRALGDLSIALVVTSSLALLGLPAAVRRGQHHRTGMADVDVMSGEEFEQRLAALFEALGEVVHHTGRRGDFGADLVTERAGVRTVVQAKRYEGAVGIEAVQQVVGARRYYEAERARVVTNSVLTPAALALATVADVEVVERGDLFRLLASHPERDRDRARARGRTSVLLCRQVLDGALLVAFALRVTCRLGWRVLRAGARAGRRVVTRP